MLIINVLATRLVSGLKLNKAGSTPSSSTDRTIKIVNRPSTKEWLEKTGTDKIGIYVDYPLTRWEPGDFDQNWCCYVESITGKTAQFICTRWRTKPRGTSIFAYRVIQIERKAKIRNRP
ncbi:MAG: hypothetical protein WKF97_23675 [Chitinophagaceae bacterium]